jgi:tetratricopeptide (TPR) repeat protein
MKQFASICLLLILTIQHGFTDDFTDELQWLAKLTACIGQYNMAQTGDYTVKDPQDYYRPSDIREWLARQSGSRTTTATFYGICFDYAQAAYNTISQNRTQYERLGMRRGGWYIVGVGNNPRQITLYDPVARDKATVIMNGVPLKENSRQNVRSHGDATNHAWLWVYGNDGTIYWIDPTWTDNSGYVWWGVVRNGEETQARPSTEYCMVTIPSVTTFDYFNSGYANYQKGDSDRAIADYTQAIRIDPNLAIAYCNRGLAYYKKGMYDQAIVDYNQALWLDPNDALAYDNRGAAYHGKGDYDRAIADYNQAIQLDPNLVLAYNNRGFAYYNKGDYDRAIRDYEVALRIDPNYVYAYNNRGLAYYAKQNYDRAITDHTQAIRLDPNGANAYYLRGLAYENKGDYDRAIADYTQAIRLDPNGTNAYFGRGLAYDKKGDYDRAIADYTQTIRLDPNDAIAYNNRGNAYYEKGDYNRAIADFEVALRIDPNLPYVRESIEYARRDRGY